jgi:hypothetical protein
MRIQIKKSVMVDTRNHNSIFLETSTTIKIEAYEVEETIITT